MEEEYEDEHSEGAQPEEETHCTCAESIEEKREEEADGLGCLMVGHRGFPSRRSLFNLAREKPSTRERASYSMSSDVLRDLLDIPKRFAIVGVSTNNPIPVCLVGRGGWYRRTFSGIGHMSKVLQVPLGTVTSRMDKGDDLLVGVNVPGVKSGRYEVEKSDKPFYQRCEHVNTKGRNKGEMCDREVCAPDWCSQHRADSLKSSLDRLRMNNNKEFLALTRWMVEMSGSRL